MSAGKSENVALLDALQAPTSAYLKQLKFKKAGRNHSRVVRDGIVQVVHFQAGLATSALHGSFAVNLGVYLPCSRRHSGLPTPKVVHEYDCTIRTRLSPDQSKLDRWWPIVRGDIRTGDYVLDLVVRVGLPFLEELASYEGVLAYVDRRESFPTGTRASSALIAAIAANEIGQVSRADSYIETALARSRDDDRFNQRIQRVAEKLRSERLSSGSAEVTGA